MSKALPEHLRVPWGVRDGLWFAAAWIGLPILLLIELSMLSRSVPLVHSFLIGFRDNDVAANFTFVIINSLVAAGLFYYYLRRYKVGFDKLGLRRFPVLRSLGYLLGAFLVFAVLVLLAEAAAKVLIPGFNPDQAQVNEFTNAAQTGQHRVLAFFALVVLPPLVEETIFRGFLFPAFAKRWGLAAGAVIVSLLFGIAHWQGNVTVYTIVLSLVLCMMYYKLGSLWPGIALHMINNLLAFIVLIHP